MDIIIALMKRILAWFCKTSDRTASFAIAGVNTTLLAVLVASLSAYIVFVYNIVQQAEIKAIEEAEKINSITFLVHQCPYRSVETTEVFEKKKLIDMMFKLTTWSDDISLPKDVNSRAQKALGIMGALVGQYPFPVLYFKTKEDKFASRSDAEPISFANLNEVHTWIKAVNETTRPFTLEFAGLPSSLLPLLREFGKSEYVAQLRDAATKSPLLGPMLSKKLIPGFGTHATLASLDPVEVYDDFLNRIAEVMSIIKSTQNYVQRADALRKGYPSKHTLKILSFLILVAFASGVIYPLAATKVWRAFALWLPFLIYVMIYGYALRIVISH